MNILVISQYYYPESIGPSEICESLNKMGNNVTVITGLPNYHYPNGKVSKNYKHFKNRKENINGIDVQRTFTIGRRKGKKFLALNYLSFCISANFKSLFLSNKYDVVICYQLSPITMAIPAVKYAKRKKKKLLLYCLDLWPESLKTVGISEKSRIYKTLYKISKKIYNSCDRILVSSEFFKEYLKEIHNVDQKKIFYLPQYSKDYGEKIEHKLDDKIIKDNKVNFLFAGNIGKAQNIELIIEALTKIDNLDNILIHIVGDGSNLENLKNEVKSKYLNNNVIFYGQVNKDDMYYFYDMADFCLLTLISDNSVGKTIPLKLQSYMSSGKPIIASIDGESKKLIQMANCGICLKPNDVNELAKAISDCANNVEKYKYLGENGRKYYLENFTLDKYMNRFLNNINEMLGEM